jgi:uncharacterized protein (DUF58 family)
MMRPTARAVLLFVCGIPPALFLMIFDPELWPWSLAYGALVLGLIAADAAMAFPPRALRIAATVPVSLQIGETGALVVSIAATPHRGTTAFDLLAEHRGEADPPPLMIMMLPPQSGASASIPLVPRQRGRLFVDAVWLRWRGPLRLTLFSRRVAVDRVIDVLPNVRGVHAQALQFFAREAVFGTKVQQQKGEGTEFDALREYAPGLDSRFIDWKHSARHGRLLCKEFRTERNHHVVLAFDTGYLMREPLEGLPRLDHAINAGLLLAWISLQGGDLVGVFGFDAAPRQFQQPLRGMTGFSRLQRAAAGLEYRHEETNFTLGLASLNARLKRRALVILFTDFVDTVTAELLVEATERVAKRHVVVFVTLRDAVLDQVADAPPGRFEDVAKAVVAHDFLRDRTIVLERLQRLGVHCLDVPSRSLPVTLINRYLLVKQRGLL